MLGDIGRGLPGDQPARPPGRCTGWPAPCPEPAGDPPLMPGRYPGDRHDPGPAAPVEPGPPPAPGRSSDPPGERARPEPPPAPARTTTAQAARKTRPSQPTLTHVNASRARTLAASGCRTTSRTSQASSRASCTSQDDADGGLVDRRPPAGQRERVPVVQLGHLLAGHDLAHSLVTSFVHTGENPGAAGGTSSGRPASIYLCCHHAARPADSSAPVARGSWRRAFPARPRTGSRPRPAGGRTARRPRSPRPGRGW